MIGKEEQWHAQKTESISRFFPRLHTFSCRWKMGGYIRLSKEDLKKALNGKDDSNSVKNQRDLLAMTSKPA